MQSHHAEFETRGARVVAVAQGSGDEAARPGALKAMLDYYRAYGRGGGARRERLRGSPPIETPTLLLWGEDDVVLGRDLALASLPFVKDLTLRWLPGVSHWAQQDAPEQVNAMLAAFLRGAPVPEAVP